MEREVDWRRSAWIVGIVVGGIAAYAAVVIAPPLYALLPWTIRGYPAPWLTGLVLLLDASARLLARRENWPRLRARLEWMDTASSWILRCGLSIGVATACGLIVLTGRRAI